MNIYFSPYERRKGNGNPLSFHISVEIEDGKLTAHTKNTQTLMFKCSDFEDSELYINFRDDVVRSLKER